MWQEGLLGNICPVSGCAPVLQGISAQSRPIAFQELLNLADDGDPHAAQALSKQAQIIGRGLQPVILGLSPSVIFIAGDIMSAWHRFGPILEKEVAPNHEVQIAWLRGAAALVFQRRHVLSPTPDVERKSARVVPEVDILKPRDPVAVTA